MLRTERAAAGRVWLLLRAFDAPGRGMVDVADARAALTAKGSPLRLCGWRRLRQLLAEGDGVFWARERDRLRLCGPARVAAALGVARLGNRPVGVPAAALLGSIGDARAQLYAAFHSGRARLVTNQVPGSRFQVPGEERSSLAPGPWPLAPSAGMPISRDTLTALSGACPRSQAAYERRAGVASRGNFALGERVPGGAGAPAGDMEQERAWRQGRALFRLTDYHGQQGAPGATYLAWRLPNTYGSARGHQPRPKGRQKRINRQLADLFMKGMTGNGGRPIEKRFYATALAAYRRAERVVDERQSVHHPHSLHWPDGRTRGGAGVWRVVGELNTQ